MERASKSRQRNPLTWPERIITFFERLASEGGQGYRVASEKVIHINGVEPGTMLYHLLVNNLSKELKHYITSDGPIVCCCISEKEDHWRADVRMGSKFYNFHFFTTAQNVRKLVKTLCVEFAKHLEESESEVPKRCFEFSKDCFKEKCPIDYNQNWRGQI